MTSPIRGLRVGESVSTLLRGPKSDSTTRSQKERTMALPRSLTRAASAVFLAAALAVSAGGATVLAADPPTTTDPGAAAAGWLAVQVEAGVGPGSLADAIFAYAATGAGADAAADALAQLESGIEGYILSSGALLPGNLAKTMLAVQVAGGDPNDFGGHDLEADLRGLIVTTPGPDLGRFGSAMNSDQSLAILALSRTSGGAPSESVDWLVTAQCPNGDYQWDGSCPGAGAEDPDTTALALQALLAGGASAAAGTSTDLLLSIKGADGSFSSFGTPNTNSTGVASQALRAAGQTAAADDAGAWVLTLQYGCDAPAADRGAFPWAASSAGFLVFSTPQAVLALGAPSLADLSLAGASAAAPILACDDEEPTTDPTDPAPTDDGGAGPTITLPPTDATVAISTASEGGTSVAIAALLALVAAGGAVVTVRRRAPR